MRQTKPRQKPRNVTTIGQTAPRPQDDDPVPENIDDFRNALARRIHRFIGDRARTWRDCPQPACRRARRCFAPRGTCANPPPLPPSTPEQTAHAMAALQRMLRERLEKDGSRSEGAGK